MAHDDRIRCRVCGAWLGAINWMHLRAHGMTTDDYRRRFGVDFLVSGAARAKMSRAKAPRRKFVPRTKAQIIVKLKQTPAGHIHGIRDADPGLASQATYLFGDWASALRAAGHDYAGLHRWSPEDVLTELRERSERDQSINDNALKKENRPLYAAARTHFGGLKQAVLAAGLDYASVRVIKKRTRRSIARDVRDWCEVNGPLNAQALRESNAPLYQAAYKAYGSIEECARRLRLRSHSRLQHWSRERIVAEIKRRARRGGALNHSSVRSENSSLVYAAERHFGTWSEALAAAGLDTSRIVRHKRHTLASLTRDLCAWSRRNGPMNDSALSASEPALVSAVRRHFGSLKSAARSLGLPWIQRGARVSPRRQ